MKEHAVKPLSCRPVKVSILPDREIFHSESISDVVIVASESSVNIFNIFPILRKNTATVSCSEDSINMEGLLPESFIVSPLKRSSLFIEIYYIEYYLFDYKFHIFSFRAKAFIEFKAACSARSFSRINDVINE